MPEISTGHHLQSLFVNYYMEIKEMSKHTPGPWELSISERNDGHGTYRNVQESASFGDVVASVCVRHKANHTLNEAGSANAHLIAAAPELLAELKACETHLHAYVEAIEYDGGSASKSTHRLASVRAAIAKAEGEK